LTAKKGGKKGGESKRRPHENRKKWPELLLFGRGGGMKKPSRDFGKYGETWMKERGDKKENEGLLMGPRDRKFL